MYVDKVFLKAKLKCLCKHKKKNTRHIINTSLHLQGLLASPKKVYLHHMTQIYMFIITIPIHFLYYSALNENSNGYEPRHKCLVGKFSMTHVFKPARAQCLFLFEVPASAHTGLYMESNTHTLPLLHQLMTACSVKPSTLSLAGSVFCA